MCEPIYKIGDILEFTEVVPRQFGLWTGPVRGLVVKISDPGYEYLSYRLLLSGSVGASNNMTFGWAFEKNIASAAKRVGHIDISSLMFKENDEPDYEKMMADFACVESANLRHELVSIKNENETLKMENEKLKADNKKLTDGRARYLQKITCAEKELTEATKRMYAAREHLNVAMYYNNRPKEEDFNG